MQYRIMPIIHDYTRKGTSRLRKGRYSERNQIYHINASTRGRAPIFRDLAAGRILTQSLLRAQTDGHAETLAFTIMPDHLHWLLRLTGKRSLGDCVGVIKSESARRINALCGSEGTVWQNGFYDRAIRKEDDLPNIASYIIANPVRAGLVASVGKYALWDSIWV
jgi:putative transposase